MSTLFVPPGFGEKETEPQEALVKNATPRVILDTVFIRHGDQFENKETKHREDRLSPEGIEQAIDFAKTLSEKDSIRGFCGNTERAKEYLRIIMEHCPPKQHSRTRVHPSLNALNAQLSARLYDKQRREQIEELAYLIGHYRKIAESVQKSTRIALLFITHTHINETLLERIIADKKGSTLFDPIAAVGLFGPGEFWIHRTTIGVDNSRNYSVVLRGKDYAIKEEALAILANNFLARKKAPIEANEDPSAKVSLSFSAVSDNPNIASKSANASYRSQVHKSWMLHEYIQFLVEESDELAKKLGDSDSSTFSRQAADVADLIKKTLLQNKPVANNQDNISAHIGVVESFLIKCIRKTVDSRVEKKPNPSVDKLVEILENGFSPEDKLQIGISRDGLGQVSITLHFHKKVPTTGKEFHFDGDISLETIDEIIAERLVIEQNID